MPKNGKTASAEALRTYRTLRGFLSGHEPDEETYFAYSASLRIFGHHLDFEDISRHLKLSPTHTHKKGERKGPRSPGYPHDMWSYAPPVEEARPLAEHIDALWASIKHAKKFLRALKSGANVDVFLGYRTNVDTAGIGVPYACLEMFKELEIPFEISIIIA